MFWFVFLVSKLKIYYKFFLEFGDFVLFCAIFCDLIFYIFVCVFFLLIKYYLIKKYFLIFLEKIEKIGKKNFLAIMIEYR